jgi:hypothetical protein
VARNIAGFDALLRRTMAVTDGFVYLETSKVLSLCLETMMLEDLIPSWSGSCTDFFLPYNMGWPHLRNYTNVLQGLERRRRRCQ